MTRALLAAALILPMAVFHAADRAMAGGRFQTIAERQAVALAGMMASVNAGDAKTYANLYAPNAVITIFGSDSLVGRDAIEQHEVELLREYPGTRLAFYAAWHHGPFAIVHYGVNGKTPAGRAMGHEGLLFFRFNDAGLIVEERRYLDSLTPMGQLGALGNSPVRALPTLPAAMTTLVATGPSDGSDAVRAARAALAAMNAHDRFRFLSLVQDDTVVDELVSVEPFAGKANVQRWFGMWAGAVPDLKVDIANIVGVGDFALAETIVGGTLRGAFGPLSPSSTPFVVHRAMVFHVRDGRVARIEAFMNGKELAEAVGQWPIRGASRRP
jgi:ketosteroid isomerase-like protein